MATCSQSHWLNSQSPTSLLCIFLMGVTRSVWLHTLSQLRYSTRGCFPSALGLERSQLPPSPPSGCEYSHCSRMFLSWGDWAAGLGRDGGDAATPAAPTNLAPRPAPSPGIHPPGPPWGLSPAGASEGQRTAGCRTGSLESSQHIKPLMGLMISGAPRGKLD